MAVLVIGVLQDVFRKLTPGVPAYYLVWGTATFGMVVAVAYRQRGGAQPAPALPVRPPPEDGVGVILSGGPGAGGPRLVRWGNPQVPGCWG